MNNHAIARFSCRIDWKLFITMLQYYPRD